jgi:hypothetical protein
MVYKCYYAYQQQHDTRQLNQGLVPQLYSIPTNSKATNKG